MPPPAAVKPSHSPTAKWTLWPYCSHSAHLLHLPLSSLSSLSPFSISSLQENRHWESILHHKSNHVILSFSISTLSLPPSTSSSLYHSPISPPFPCSASDSMPCSEGASNVLKDGSQGVENFLFPGVWYHIISWRFCSPLTRTKCWKSTFQIHVKIYRL